MIYKLSEKGKEYNEECGDILSDSLDNGIKKKDIIPAINYCAEIDALDMGSEIDIFLAGIYFERNRSKIRTKKEKSA